MGAHKARQGPHLPRAQQVPAQAWRPQSGPEQGDQGQSEARGLQGHGEVGGRTQDWEGRRLWGQPGVLGGCPRLGLEYPSGLHVGAAPRRISLQAQQNSSNQSWGWEVEGPLEQWVMRRKSG